MMKKKNKSRKKKGKGSAFERDICKKLSLWWSDGKLDDVFYRTAGSGARATVRGSKRTFGQYGDVQATDPIGQPLMDVCTIELKRGYSASTLSDFLDRGPKKKDSKVQLQTFIEQAITDARLRSSEGEWILMVKRDYKEVVLFTSYRLILSLLSHFWQGQRIWKHKLFPSMLLNMSILGKNRRIYICTLNWFLDHVDPEDVKKLAAKKEKE